MLVNILRWRGILLSTTVGLALVLNSVAAAAGNSRLERAAKDGDAQAVSAIVASGQAVDQRLDIGRTALMVAARYGQVGVMEVLLQAGADINAKDNNGSTALILAAEYGHMGAVKMLLANGADKTIKNGNSMTAADVARPDPAIPAIAWAPNQTEIYQVLTNAPAQLDPRAKRLPPPVMARNWATPDLVNALMFRPSRTDGLAARFEQAAKSALFARGWAVTEAQPTRVVGTLERRGGVFKSEFRLLGDTVMIGFPRGFEARGDKWLRNLEQDFERALSGDAAASSKPE